MKIYYRKKYKNGFYEITDYTKNICNKLNFTILKDGKIHNTYIYGSNFRTLQKAIEAINFDIATNYDKEVINE